MDDHIRFVSIEHDEKLLCRGGEIIDTCCFVKGGVRTNFSKSLSPIFSSVVGRLFVTSNLLHLRNIFKKVGRERMR